MRAIRLFSLLIAAVCSMSSSTKAALVTSNAAFGTAITVDFSQFTGSISTYTPVQVGSLVGVNVELSSTTFAALGNFGFGLGANGSWNLGRSGYVASTYNYPTDYAFTFLDAPVSKVGGFFNYVPGTGPVQIDALATNGTVLESYVISTLAPISTPGGLNAGAFRGISRATADIGAFRVTGPWTVMDDLAFDAQTEVPEPSSMILLGVGGLAFAATRRRSCVCVD